MSMGDLTVVEVYGGKCDDVTAVGQAIRSILSKESASVVMEDARVQPSPWNDVLARGVQVCIVRRGKLKNSSKIPVKPAQPDRTSRDPGGMDTLVDVELFGDEASCAVICNVVRAGLSKMGMSGQSYCPGLASNVGGMNIVVHVGFLVLANNS